MPLVRIITLCDRDGRHITTRKITARERGGQNSGPSTLASKTSRALDELHAAYGLVGRIRPDGSIGEFVPFTLTTDVAES